MTPYEYALIRPCPVERGEQMNVGVILYCQRLDFLAARIDLNVDRLRALDPEVDVDGVRTALVSWETTCAGGLGAGAARDMKPGERFRWLTAPRSTVLRAGPVHTGLTDDPHADLKRLTALLVS